MSVSDDKLTVPPFGSEKPFTAVVLLFEKLPNVDPVKLVESILSVEKLSSPPKASLDINQKDGIYGYVEFEDHRIRLVGIAGPVPPGVIEQTIKVSNWGQKQKQEFLKQQANIICYYEGTQSSPTERIIALYKVAHAFLNFGLLGVLDEDAWNCITRDMLADLLKPKMLHACRQQVPCLIWTGFVKFFKTNEDIWFCSKGHHRFGVPDFALLGKLSDARETSGIFNNLFHYVIDSGNKLKAGQTSQIDTSSYLRFGEITEFEQFLNGPAGTLVVTKIKPDAINKKGSIFKWW